MKLSNDTGQARDVAIIDATLPDGPVKVDIAMKAAAHEYQEPSAAELRRTAPTTVDWWRLARA